MRHKIRQSSASRDESRRRERERERGAWNLKLELSSAAVHHDDNGTEPKTELEGTKKGGTEVRRRKEGS